MTESTTEPPADAPLEVDSSIDALFEELEETDSGGDHRTETTDGDETGEGDADGVEDQTAADVFDQLRAGGTDGDADDVLADETPDDIIASVDEPAPTPATPVDDELLADDDELTEFLLTGRTKDEEFLWVETDEPDEGSDTGAETDEPDEPDATGTDPGTDDATESERIDERPGTDDPHGTASEQPPETEPDADGETARNSSPAVSSEEGVTDSTPDIDSDEPVAERETDDTGDDETESDVDAGDDEQSTTADEEPSGFLGRLWSRLRGLF
ncbi:hypothetical protein [Natrinema longum]|uniref:Uncharacterized protein n=1 Tax=Natrinema longum TaxID=370324 RepID=A0A8A2U938_9EURY|nr:hypothetical protein [Natrinema longum]MBZ6493333.1 hypothetical protein [Natrinema longum]QSW85319.1 hypothetical protein J0X27_00250 [Natrinema longum]